MKEINLYEILQGHEGKEFYSRAYGPVVFEEFEKQNNYLLVRPRSRIYGREVIRVDGKITKEGDVDLFPAHHQRFMDPYTAWQIWLSEIPQPKFHRGDRVMVCEDNALKGSICEVEYVSSDEHGGFVYKMIRLATPIHETFLKPAPKWIRGDKVKRVGVTYTQEYPYDIVRWVDEDLYYLFGIDKLSFNEDELL